MAYHHATAYEKIDECELVVCADTVRKNAEAFADKFDIDDAYVFEDHGVILVSGDLDRATQHDAVVDILS